MCTAISITKKTHLFGRTLDVAESYGEEVIITPRFSPLSFTDGEHTESHLAFIGAGIIRDGFVLYFDGMNEAGLAAAALNFPDYTKYESPAPEYNNIASFEVIPKILAKCKTVKEAKALLSLAKITDIPFSKALPPSPLHWIFSDKKEAVTAEQTKSGLHIYDNPCGILTNAPDFPFHIKRLSEFSALSPKNPASTLINKHSFFSGGYGALGLPGDFSSPSRFIRADFLSKYTKAESDGVSAFFHIMDSVSIPDGAMIGKEGKPHKTVYTACMDTDSHVYYFHTYENRRIRAVRLEARAASLSYPTHIPMHSPEDTELLAINYS